MKTNDQVAFWVRSSSLGQVKKLFRSFFWVLNKHLTHPKQIYIFSCPFFPICCGISNELGPRPQLLAKDNEKRLKCLFATN